MPLYSSLGNESKTPYYCTRRQVQNLQSELVSWSPREDLVLLVKSKGSPLAEFFLPNGKERESLSVKASS